jgi:hypothetical protein
MEFILWLQENAVAVWTRESVSLWAYPTQIAIHALGLGVVVGLSTMVALRVLGVASQIPLPPLERVFPVIWVAFFVNLFSGTLMTLAYAERLLLHPVFLIKLAGLVAGVVLIVYLRKFAFGPTAVASRAQAVSVGLLVAWAITLVAGRMTAYDSLLEATFG